MSTVFANGPGDWGSNQGRVIPKTQKTVLDATLLNAQHYNIQIKSKVEQSRERSSALPYTLFHHWLSSPTLLTIPCLNTVKCKIQISLSFFPTYKQNLFNLVWFYSISLLEGYLMPNPVHKYVYYIYNLRANSL